MFSQVNTMLPDPNGYASLGWIVVGAAALIAIVRNGVGLWRDVSRPSGSDAMAQASDKYQPRGDYVTRQELEEKLSTISEELESVRQQIVTSEHRSSEASEERIKTVHNRLDIMPDRIITMLTNLGVLRRPESE